ncbi:MAG: carbamoyl-phosphate synthase small subunit [Acidobacteria bacterium]|nr:MAG: carbamoyl-phosphate synthase small subunit [Acidobacteriota bacterium]
MEALLALEDGRVFRGTGHGGIAKTKAGAGEVVFNTSMTGYQEICTDPSYAGQIVCLTAPQIGNYGTTAEDDEANHPFVEGLIVREFSSITSNWRSQQDCQDYLDRFGIPVLAGIDTRALVRHLRSQGVLRGVIAPAAGASIDALVARARAIPPMTGTDLAQVVSTKSPYDGPPPSSLEIAPLVVAFDYGMKRNITRQLAGHGCRVRVVPAKTSAADVLALHPDGVFLSNGPGDPEPCTYAVETIRGLMGRVPIFGICLGHQLIGLALGGKTYKLKFGHHGGNHPVRYEPTGRIEITAHNHNFAVDPDSLRASDVDLTHFDLNDGTLEGLRHRSLPLFSVQYHPEAAPGPHDSQYLFHDFVTLMTDRPTDR